MSAALITGITGFAGSHLAEYLLRTQPGLRVGGFLRTTSSRQYIQNKPIDVYEGDLDASDIDADVADVIVQYAVLGEIVFG